MGHSSRQMEPTNADKWDILLFQLDTRSAAGAKRGFEAELAGGTLGPTGSAKGSAAVDARPEGGQLRFGARNGTFWNGIKLSSK